MDEFKQYDNNGVEINSAEAVPVPPPAPTPEIRYRVPRTKWIMLSLVLIILGAVMISLGLATGSRGGRIHFANGLHVEPSTWHSANRDSRETFYNALDIHTIDVTTVFNNVHVIPTSNPYPSVFSARGNFTAIVTDGVLSVSTPETAGAHHFMRNVGTLYIGPAGISMNRYTRGNVDYRYLEFGFGNMHRNRSSNIRVYVPDSAQHFNVSVGTGNIRMDGINAETANLNTSTGNIHFSEGYLANGNVQTRTGTIRISPDASIPTNIDAQSTTGSIHFDGGEMSRGAFRTTTGTIRVNGEIEGNFSANTTTGTIHVNDASRSHNHSGEITLGATTGTIRFDTGAPESNFNYNITATTGTMRTNGQRRDTRHFSGGNGSIPVNVRTTTGNIHLDFGG